MMRMEQERKAEQVGKLRGVQCAGAVLGLGVMMLACVPDVGAVTWFLCIPVALIVIVLSIISLAKGGFFFGVFGLLGGLIVIPLWCFMAPLVIQEISKAGGLKAYETKFLHEEADRLDKEARIPVRRSP
jgi:hypothetical protein